jgi:hypothetical protein
MWLDTLEHPAYAKVNASLWSIGNSFVSASKQVAHDYELDGPNLNGSRHWIYVMKNGPGACLSRLRTKA